MKRTMNLLGLALVAAVAVASGCSKSNQPNAVALQGTWTGQEIGASTKGSPSLAFSGTNLEFHGADTNEWYKGTFILREDTNPKQLVAVVTDCPAPQYVGKTVNAIYRIEAGALTIAGNEPGNPAIPVAFDAPGARRFVFKPGRP